MAYFRVKRRRLGPAYERFLNDHLEPGGLIIVAECGKRWPVTHLGDRHLFQFGAVGGIPPAEYRDGSDRAADYLRRYRTGKAGWTAPPADGDAPEAEWGFERCARSSPAIRYRSRCRSPPSMPAGRSGRGGSTAGCCRNMS